MPSAVRRPRMTLAEQPWAGAKPQPWSIPWPHISPGLLPVTAAGSRDSHTQPGMGRLHVGPASTSPALPLPAQTCSPAHSHWYTMPWGSARLAHRTCPTAPEHMGRKQLQSASRSQPGERNKGEGLERWAFPHHCPYASAAEEAVEGMEQRDAQCQAGQGAATTVCCYPESKQESSGCTPCSR